METITEDYVSFETAKLLKEKGMDKSCFKRYVQKNNDNGTSEAVTVCTLQMAMKWLRKVHNLCIFVKPQWAQGDMRNPVYWYPIIESLEDNKTIYNNTMCSRIYEEACEAGIKYCLENLI